MTDFIRIFEQQGDYSLQGMREVAISLLPKDKSRLDSLFESLNKGRDALEDEDLLNMYLYSYGKMHKFKLLQAYICILKKVDLHNKKIEIFDWGCGQGLATVCLLDCLDHFKVEPIINGVYLVDKSYAATNRASAVIDCILPDINVNMIRKDIDSLTKNDFPDNNVKKIHLFSNILDVESYDIARLASLFHQSFSGENYIVCVGPCYNRERIDEFFVYLEPDTMFLSIDKERGEWINDWSLSLRICSYCIPYQQQQSWIDNYGAKYSMDWKTLLKGPAPETVRTMVINSDNYHKEDLWVSQPCVSRKSGKTTYWCNFNGFEDGILMYLSNSIWSGLEEVNKQTVWEVISNGDYIIREAINRETGEWLIDEENRPIMQISKMQRYARCDWDTGKTYPYFKELKDPDEYSIKPGTISIKDYAFSNCKFLQTITIPDSVERIGYNVFKSCDSLQKIIIPYGTYKKFSRLLPVYKDILLEQEKHEDLNTEVTDEDLANAWVDEFGVKYSADRKRLLLIPENITDYRIRKGTIAICYNAFGEPNVYGHLENNLQSIYLPDTIRLISPFPLIGSLHLNKIVVDDNNPVFDSRDNCNAIIRTESNELILGCQTTVIPNGISCISLGAFGSCTKLKSICIPDSVITIGESAFMNCERLTEIYIPASVNSIGNRAFNGCGIERVIVDKNNSIYDSRDNCNAIISTSDNKLIFGCKNTIIPITITTIGNNAFECCELNEIVIPNTIKSIESWAFSYCEDLESITFPSSLTSIDTSAFFRCKNLTTLIFTNSVEKIGFQAFYGCEAIEQIIIPKGTRKKYERLLPDYVGILVEHDEYDDLPF